MNFGTRLLLASLATLSLASATAAQSVRGRVLDEQSGQGIPGVKVTLLNDKGGRVAETISNAQGGFMLAAKGTGQHRIRTSHIGYADLETDQFSVLAEEQVIVDLKLSAAAIVLEPLTIVSRQKDPRTEPTEEGMYARRLTTPPIGPKRVMLPHDPEMVSSSRVTDLFTWLPRSRGCMIVYWNGRLVQQADIAADWLQTSTTMLEAVEYYRTPLDAPAAFREMPPYVSFDNVQCSVIALWPKTGRYLAEEAPIPLQPYNGRANLAAALYYVSGKYAPGVGVGLEGSIHWPVGRSISVGLNARATVHTLSEATANEMTSTLSATEFLLPPGERSLQLYVIGFEPRMAFRQDQTVRFVLGSRLQVAQRRFDMTSTAVTRDKIGVRSYGIGLGATGTVEWQLSGKLAANASIGQDWFTFNAYKRIERQTTPTAANWLGTSLKLGVAYNPTW
jgi:hypothetical protein